MPVRVVLDSTVLISAFLNPNRGGAAYDLVQALVTHDNALYLSREILDEVDRVLLTRARIRKKYRYSDADVATYRHRLENLAVVLQECRPVRVVRDRSDDMVVACALEAQATFLASRDDDLLSLESFRNVQIVSPEELLAILRAERRRQP